MANPTIAILEDALAEDLKSLGLRRDNPDIHPGGPAVWEWSTKRLELQIVYTQALIDALKLVDAGLDTTAAQARILAARAAAEEHAKHVPPIR
jgi:hypothetical protein